jgi:hypothetical protein
MQVGKRKKEKRKGKRKLNLYILEPATYEHQSRDCTFSQLFPLVAGIADSGAVLIGNLAYPLPG